MRDKQLRADFEEIKRKFYRLENKYEVLRENLMEYGIFDFQPFIDNSHPFSPVKNKYFSLLLDYLGLEIKKQGEQIVKKTRKENSER